jgi:hypothetical protein
LGKRLHREPNLPGFGIELHKTGVCANKRVPFPIRLDALCPTDRLENDWKFFETVARQLVESEVPSNQKRSIGSLANRSTRSGRNPLLRSKGLEAFPVVPEDTVFRAHPNETYAVLVDLPDCEVVEAFCDPEVAEIVFLSAQDPGRQHEESEYARR